MGKALFSLILVGMALGAGEPDRQLDRLIGQFAATYKALDLPPFGPDYAANFKAIPDLATAGARLRKVSQYTRRIHGFPARGLRPDSRYALLFLRFAFDSSLERLTLERQFRAGGGTIPVNGLATLPNRQRWYELYARQSASRPIRAEEVMALGRAEVARVTAEIARLGAPADEPPFTDPAAVQAAFQEVQARVLAHLSQVVPVSTLPPLAIAPIPNPGPDTPPAAYQNGTFYFGMAGGRFPRRALDWSFLHEAVPGHHYQTTLPFTLAPALQDLFYLPGFTEGWGAYAEDLGSELGLYTTPAAELGKWEWDLVRSARVVLDVGIHVHGWTRAQALAYWQANVPGQDAIATRELDRITRWPAQVISYKVGEQAFLTLRKEAQTRQGKAFDLAAFHGRLLSRGAVPLTVLRALAAAPR